MHRCRSDILELIPADQAQLVEWLAVPHQSAYAIRKLKQLGSRAVPSLRHGLKHPEHLDIIFVMSWGPWTKQNHTVITITIK